MLARALTLALAFLATGQEDAARIERLIETAREGRPIVRPQAAERLLGMGPEVATRLEALTRTDAAGLGPELIAILPRVGDEELRERTWRLLADPDFPWRPAAVRGLSNPPENGEVQRFVPYLTDPLAAVRVAALEALGGLDAEVAALVRQRLADEDGAVRRRAAAWLVERGETCAAHWLLAELSRDDRFFSLPTGKMARYEAWRLLGQLGLTEGLELDPEALPEATAGVREGLLSRLEEGCPEAPELSATALPGGPREGDVLGLELRSCRRGEFFLRWNEADILFVGLGRPAQVALAEGTVARLQEAAALALEGVGEARFWGTPGCDLERLHVVLDAADGGREEILLLSKGPEAAADLRPDPLDTFVGLLLESLPEGGPDPRLRDLRSRVRGALAVLGGDPGVQED